MRGPAQTPFGAVFRIEVLLNSKRVAPYAMALLFAANALLWWGWGPAAYYGWATNGDFFIGRIFTGFSFMTLPLFTALVMGDPVTRDFRAGVDPLIFSKPVGRAAYLLGKFCGNFFVLVCCQAAFALTLLLLQALPKSQMVVQPARVAPYVKHFLLLVVVSHLALAAVHFTVGTLTRNPKIVYGSAVLFYPLYAAYQALFLRELPQRWRVALDPLLLNWADLKGKGRGGGWLDAETINQLALSYDADTLANRAMMILIATACLTLLYVRFSTVERPAKSRAKQQLTTIDLAARDERLDRGEEGFDFARHEHEVEEAAPLKTVALPKVRTSTGGARAGLRQFVAATRTEIRLLLSERSLVVLLPLATLVSVLPLAYYEAAPAPFYSAAYAGRAAESFLLFLIAIAVFYTGEAMHRDRELRVEPVLWSAPAPNFALLLSKFATTLLLSLSAVALVGAAAVALQVYKGHGPVEVLTHLTVYSLILLPSAAFMIAAAALFNVMLREKYLTYAACLAVVGGTFYLFNLGHNHWLYNPVLYGLWTPSDLTAGTARLPLILTHRLYCLALAALCLSLAHLLFERRSMKSLRAGGRLGARGWAILSALFAAALAVVAGLMINASAPL